MSDPHAVHDLARRARHGALATVARDPQGWPFASLVAVAFDPAGRPLLFLSGLAEHTKNLEASARASLLVVDAAADGDPLASGRMTVVGTCRRVAEPERDRDRSLFVAAHPEAAGYAGLADFAVWRIEVEGARWVGGFGHMQWLGREAYFEAMAGRTD